MNEHQVYMQRCLTLAAKGFGAVAPNPMVGAVLVHNGKMIGEGYHQLYGGPHAEVNAIRAVAHETLLKDATLYVSLEPCTHFGKTPPCADLILQKQIPRVVIASTDPNPLVAGNGIRKLQAAGVEVISGVMQKEADFLNRRFITFHTRQRPYIILKWAQSADGIMAPAELKQLWLTNALSKKLVHQWRSEEQAVLIGRGTLEADNPLLTVRLVQGANPVRIVIGKEIGSKQYKLYSNEAPVWLFNAEREGKEAGVRYIKPDYRQPVLPQVMHYLWQNNIQSLIVEGGPVTLQHFVQAGLWDEARIFTTGHMLKEGKKPPLVDGTLLNEEMIDTDKLSVWLNTGKRVAVL